MLGAEALDLLKSDIPQEQSTHDGGISDVLQTFAAYLGYRFIDESECPDAIKHGWNGELNHRDRTIFISSAMDEMLLTEVMAHEIAHHFQFSLLQHVDIHPRVVWVFEQVAEAVAIMFLYDYGVNVVENGRLYIKSFVVDEEGFHDGVLDKAITMVYLAFSQEFEAFLRD